MILFEFRVSALQYQCEPSVIPSVQLYSIENVVLVGRLRLGSRVQVNASFQC